MARQEPCNECLHNHTSICGNCKDYDEFEPCDDAISREAVLSLWGLRLSDKEIYMAIHDMPPVTQKSGKWIDHSDEGYVECPFCEHATNCEDNIDELHYCFWCGARMVEPQESEEQTE